MSAELIALSATTAAGAIAAGELDRAEYFEAYRARSAADELNAYVWVAEEATEAVEGELGGVPIAIKDLFCTEGVPSQAGSKILEGYRPPYSATVVERLTAAGTVLLGKTNQDEFAMGSSNENSAYGPVLNPWDRTRVPGGSSGGSAAAVAAGLAPLAIGTDTGGSIRQPAALCGVVGLKPTYGSVSRYGMIAFASSLDQAGPFARDVTDAALLYRHMAAKDGRDATSVGHPEELVLPTRQELTGVRLGVAEDLTGDGVRDIFASAYKIDIAGKVEAGVVFLVNGATRSVASAIASATSAMSRFAFQTRSWRSALLPRPSSALISSSSRSEPRSRACGSISRNVRLTSWAMGIRFRRPVARSITGASRPYRAASHLFSLVRIRWNVGICSPAS